MHLLVKKHFLCWYLSVVIIGYILPVRSFGQIGEFRKGTSLCQGYYQSEEEAIEQLERFQDSYHNLDQWKRRVVRIRHGILQGAELYPIPPKTPLHPIIRNKREYTNYTVENVAFESIPGVFVTGSLYRPVRDGGPFPGILCPHGHWNLPEDYGRY